jgi:hypothetical protein
VPYRTPEPARLRTPPPPRRRLRRLPPIRLRHPHRRLRRPRPPRFRTPPRCRARRAGSAAPTMASCWTPRGFCGANRLRTRFQAKSCWCRDAVRKKARRRRRPSPSEHGWGTCNAMRGAQAPCTLFHPRALHRDALHCNALHCNALHCNALHCNALHCDALHCDALRCDALRPEAAPTRPLVRPPLLGTRFGKPLALPRESFPERCAPLFRHRGAPRGRPRQFQRKISVLERIRRLKTSGRPRLSRRSFTAPPHPENPRPMSVPRRFLPSTPNRPRSLE